MSYNQAVAKGRVWEERAPSCAMLACCDLHGFSTINTASLTSALVHMINVFVKLSDYSTVNAKLMGLDP